VSLPVVARAVSGGVLALADCCESSEQPVQPRSEHVRRFALDALVAAMA
jgi:hypothetical protein